MVCLAAGEACVNAALIGAFLGTELTSARILAFSAPESVLRVNTDPGRTGQQLLCRAYAKIRSWRVLDVYETTLLSPLSSQTPWGSVRCLSVYLPPAAGVYYPLNPATPSSLTCQLLKPGVIIPVGQLVWGGGRHTHNQPVFPLLRVILSLRDSPSGSASQSLDLSPVFIRHETLSAQISALCTVVFSANCHTCQALSLHASLSSILIV